MTTKYLDHILPLEEEGKTPAEIAAYLAPKTANGIRCSDVKILLEENGLVVEDPITRDRSGTLVSFYQSMPTTNPIQIARKQLLGWFVGHVFGRGEEISSHTQPRATMVVDTIANLPGDMQPVGAALIALGGGQPHAGLTEQDVIDLKTNYVAQQERDDAVAAVNSKAGLAMNAAQAARNVGQTPTEILAAAEAAWSA